MQNMMSINKHLLVSYKIYNLPPNYKEAKQGSSIPSQKYFLVIEQGKLANMPAFRSAINLRQLYEEAKKGGISGNVLPTVFIYIINIKVNFLCLLSRIVLGLLMV